MQVSSGSTTTLKESKKWRTTKTKQRLPKDKQEKHQNKEG